MKNCFPSHSICKSTAIVLFILYLLPLPSPATGSDLSQRPLTPPDNLVDEKTRLGSTPPSCYNKCNLCHPCTAVEVPSSQLRRVRPELNRAAKMFSFEPASPDDGYSDYKPLSWKCRCRNHLFSP